MTNLRYARLEAVPGIGAEGVAKLNNGRVVVIGCGALGSLCAMYLAGSGVGTIGIADFDTIDISNLQRQLFFDENCLGASKAEILCKRLTELNGEIRVRVINQMITSRNASEFFKSFDFVVDGSDNPATKMMTATVCEQAGIPYCIGGVREFAGQVMTWAPGHAGYADLFGDEVACNGFTPCSAGGVVGPAAGVTASVQASEVIKFLTGYGTLLLDRIYTFDMAVPFSSIYTI